MDWGGGFCLKRSIYAEICNFTLDTQNQLGEITHFT